MVKQNLNLGLPHSAAHILYLIRRPAPPAGRRRGICHECRCQDSRAFSLGLHSEQWQQFSRDSQTPDAGNLDCPHPAGGASIVLVHPAQAPKTDANSCLFRSDTCFIPNQKKLTSGRKCEVSPRLV